ncbi:MAG: 50S ribosomal protein L21 [Holosporales bacterium]|jgi:large subunit ribosomal protein L21|nr:50S ribosomal protein L21 [Holosporales bacterium]
MNMFAIIKTGGQQYRVSEGSVIKAERLAGESGDTVNITDVLMLSDGDQVNIGNPTVAGVVVQAEIVKQARTPKVIVFKKTRRHNYRRKRGHRQNVSILKITGIVVG